MKQQRTFKPFLLILMAALIVLSPVIFNNIYADTALGGVVHGTVTYNGSSTPATFTITKEADGTDPGEVELNSVNMGDGQEGMLKVPDEVTDGDKIYKVTGIGLRAFENCETITNLDFSGNKNMKYIGDFAFYKCKNLESTGIENNKSIETIGELAFAYCNKITSTGLETNSSVETIGKEAFGYCYSLKSTSLGMNSRVSSIGEYAFVNCDHLTTFIFDGKTIPTIGEHAFNTGSRVTLYYPETIAQAESDKLSGKSAAAVKSFYRRGETTDRAGNYHAGQIYACPDDMEVKLTYISKDDAGNDIVIKGPVAVTYKDCKSILEIPKGYTLKAGENTIEAKCDGRDMTYTVTASDHTAGEWIVDKEAAKNEAGSMHKECTVCRITMATEEIPASEATPAAAGKTPDTGDGNNIGLFIALLLLSGSVILGISRRKEK